MSLDETTFDSLDETTLSGLMARIDDAAGDRLDVDFVGGVLTIELDTGGQYVLNKHAPNRQIWMSSPVSGASHFDYRGEGEGWRDTRTGHELRALLGKELAEAVGRVVALV